MTNQTACIFILILLFLIVGVFFTERSYVNCSNEGGTLVQGDFWYECVDKERVGRE